MATHDLNLAASICHELVLMRGGRVLAAGLVTATLVLGFDQRIAPEPAEHVVIRSHNDADLEMVADSLRSLA